MEFCVLTAMTKGERRTFRLEAGQVATLGRSSSCSFRVPDPRVSREHCLLSFQGGCIEVRDLGSVNELGFLGERRSVVQLRPGEGFHVGNTFVRFERVEGAPGPSDVEASVHEPIAVERAAPEPLPLVCRRHEIPHPGEPATGQVLGNHRLERVLGRSDRCTVFAAVHERLAREVALKWVRQDGDVRARVDRFLADMRRSASVVSPHMVALFDVDPKEGACFAVMEQVSGRSLASRVLDGPRLSWPEVVQATTGVLEALVALHASGIVHAAVKPENVFLLPDGSAKLADLRAEPSLRPGESDGCAAPELVARGIASARSDLYSVGAVAFAALTGGLGPRSAAASAGPRAVLQRDASLPPTFVAWLESLLAEEPATRPASAREALDALAKVAVAPEPGPTARGVVPPSDARPAPRARDAMVMRKAPASPAKVFLAKLTAQSIVFVLILACGIALLLAIKIKWPEFDIYRLLGGSGGN